MGKENHKKQPDMPPKSIIFVEILIKTSITTNFIQTKKSMKNKKMFAAPLSFDGRIGRLEYLLTLLIVLTAVSVIVFFRLYGFINGDVESCIKDNSVPILTLTVWFELAQAIKRCHDIGYSGWVLLIPLMPIIILFIKGDEQNNEYNIQSINENEVAANIDYKSGTMGNSFVRFYLCMMMLFASGIITYLISWFNTTTGIVQNIGLTTQFLSKTIFFIGILLLFHYQKVGFYFVTYGGIFQFINCILYFKDILTSFLFTPITLMFGGCVKIGTSSYLFFYRHGVERFLLRYFFDVKSVTSTREAAFCVI